MSTLEQGQQFERYRINRYLGSGVAGESYEAEDTKLQRKVTLKLIHPWFPLPEAAKRQFMREMQDIATLEHLYLAATSNYGEARRQLFVARRYITPGSLLGSEGRYWYSPPLTISAATSYIRQLAEALHAIHTHGYTHGAVTMSNILVLRGPQQDPEPSFAPFIIADPGLAYFMRRFGQPKSPSHPVTAAPEQFGGRAVPASDQYALAVLFYFWVTGRLPFVGSPDTIEQKKLSEQITPLSILNPQITIEQDIITRRALSVYPEDRFPSILNFSEALCTALLRPAEMRESQATALDPTKEAEQVEGIASVPITPPLPVEIVLPLANATPLVEEQTPVEPPLLPPISTPLDNTGSREPLEPRDHAEELLAALAGISVNRRVYRTAETLPEQRGPTKERNELFALPQSASLPFPDQTIRIRAVPVEAAPSVPSAPSVEQERSEAYFIITSRNRPDEQKIMLKGTEITIGRAGSSQILLDRDPLTSRHQALLKYEGEHYVLYDLRSAYGTILNGEQLVSNVGYLLHDGDKIRIGNYELTFSWETEQADK